MTDVDDDDDDNNEWITVARVRDPEVRARIFGQTLVRDSGWAPDYARTCVTCLRPSHYVCPCRLVHYCSAACQTAHLPSHRGVCRRAKGSDALVVVNAIYLMKMRPEAYRDVELARAEDATTTLRIVTSAWCGRRYELFIVPDRCLELLTVALKDMWRPASCTIGERHGVLAGRAAGRFPYGWAGMRAMHVTSVAEEDALRRLGCYVLSKDADDNNKRSE